MSVIITVKVPADPAKAAAYAAANAAFIQAISQKGKSMGAIHHQFVSRPGEIMVIDEWDSAENFNRFFTEATEIGQVMEAVGAMGAPEITVWEQLDMKDAC